MPTNLEADRGFCRWGRWGRWRCSDFGSHIDRRCTSAHIYRHVFVQMNITYYRYGKCKGLVEIVPHVSANHTNSSRVSLLHGVMVSTREDMGFPRNGWQYFVHARQAAGWRRRLYESTSTTQYFVTGINGDAFLQKDDRIRASLLALSKYLIWGTVCPHNGHALWQAIPDPLSGPSACALQVDSVFETYSPLRSIPSRRCEPTYNT